MINPRFAILRSKHRKIDRRHYLMEEDFMSESDVERAVRRNLGSHEAMTVLEQLNLLEEVMGS